MLRSHTQVEKRTVPETHPDELAPSGKQERTSDVRRRTPRRHGSAKSVCANWRALPSPPLPSSCPATPRPTPKKTHKQQGNASAHNKHTSPYPHLPNPQTVCSRPAATRVRSLSFVSVGWERHLMYPCTHACMHACMGSVSGADAVTPRSTP